MPSYVALLRAINLGGPTEVPMDGLRERLALEGCRDVRTLLRSGNVVFRSMEEDPRAVERRLDERVAPALGTRTEFFVRSRDQWERIVRANPFPREALADPAHLVLTLLKTAPSADRWTALSTEVPGRERVSGRGTEAYLVYPDGIGRSKLTAARVERALGTSGTGRNWNTVLRLRDALSAGGPAPASTR